MTTLTATARPVTGASYGWRVVVTDDNGQRVAESWASRPGVTSREQEQHLTWCGLEAAPAPLLSALCDALLAAADDDVVTASAEVEL